MGDNFDSDEDYSDAGMLNQPAGDNLKPVLHNEQLPSGIINTNSTPLPQAIKEMEEETAEEKGEEAEAQTILEGNEKENATIKGSYNPFTSLKNSLDRDGDGEATMTDLAGYVKDGIEGTTSAIVRGTGADRVAEDMGQKLNYLILGVVVVGLAYSYSNSKRTTTVNKNYT